jgi:ferredoxin-NADP reductase
VLALLEALATPHGVDRYLELVHPMLTVRGVRAQVTHVHRQTPDTVTLTLRPNRRWHGFDAGQYLRVSVLVDGVLRSRCYSPANSAARGDHIELTVKAHPGGIVSGHLHATAKPGLVVDISQADGTFRLHERRPERLLLISGGSGITPVMAMLRTLVDEGHTGQVTFVHYANTEADVPYLAELRDLAARHDNITLVLAYTEASDGDLKGLFSREHLEAADPEYAQAQTYLCGPGGLMRGVRELYEDMGLGERLHTEEFAPAPVAADDDATGRVSFTRSDLAGDNTGTTLLEQAEAAGLDPEHGCRMGICFSCTQVKHSGCVRNVLTGDTSSEEDEEIQLCISVPVGDVAIDL